MILLGAETSYHDQVRRRLTRIRSQMGADVGHTIMDSHNTFRRGYSRLDGQIPIKLRDSDDLAGQWSGPTLDLAIQRCLHGWNPRGEIPPVGRQQSRDPQCLRGHAAQNARLRRVNGDELRAESL